MNKNFTTRIILCIIPLIAYTQNYKATYIIKLDQPRLESYKDKLRQSKSKDQSSIYFIRQLEQKQPVKAVLLFNKNKSVYKVLDHLNRDDFNFSGFLKSIAGGQDVYYNTSINQFSQKLMQGELNYISKEKIDWQISNQTKTIYGQTCFMAFDKNAPSNQAWFSKDLAFPFGPLYYFGLPGLILEVDFMYFEFKLIDLTMTEDNISIPQNIEIISPIEFYDKYNIKNPLKNY